MKLPFLRDTPGELQTLLDSNTKTENAFRRNIRSYNTIFAFTSLGANIDKHINDGHGPYVFRLNGQTYHRMGSLLPPEGEKPLFAQLYMYDGQDDIDGRLSSLSNGHSLDATVVEVLKDMLDRDNEMVKIFRSVRERFRNTNHMPVNLRLVADRSTDGRETNMPSNDFEFAALVPGEDFLNPRDIIVEYKSEELKRINTMHPSYMALQYPLLFPYGEDGYRENILHRGLTSASPNKRNTVTMREYYAYRLQHRHNEGHTLLKGGRLLLQFVVDAWTCIEHGRLSWVRRNQAILRSELYNNIVDSVSQGDTCALSVGKRIILPASFTGGPRYLHQNFQDSLAVSRKFAHPDLFMTFTCNPKWPEIANFLEMTPQLDPTVRPDIITRVFKMKLDELLNDITKNSIFGRVTAGIYESLNIILYIKMSM